MDLSEGTSKINVDIAGKHIRIMHYSLLVANAYDGLRRDGHDFGNYRCIDTLFFICVA